MSTYGEPQEPSEREWLEGLLPCDLEDPFREESVLVQEPGDYLLSLAKKAGQDARMDLRKL